MIRAALLVLAFLIFSCSENNLAENSTRIERNIKSTEDLAILLAPGMPVEGGISITTQAKNYTLSEIQHREEGVFYHYEPEEGFTGNDIVEITQKHSDGARVYAQTIPKVIINVTE